MSSYAACQGRQARSPGSDVTASSGTAMSTDFATRHVQKFCQKFVQIWRGTQTCSRWSTCQKKHPRKSEITASEERTQETTKKTYFFVWKTRYCAHPPEIDTTIVPETRVPDVRLSIPAVSCVVTSASAGSRGQFLPKWLKLLILLYFPLL